MKFTTASNMKGDALTFETQQKPNPVADGIDRITQQLSGVEINNSTDGIEAVRTSLVGVVKQANKLLGKTRAKSVTAILDEYEQGEVDEYISDILDGTWDEDKSKMKPVTEHDDIQRINLASNIKQAVEQSQFSAARFKIKHLQGLRSMIGQAKNIHELRQLCKIMCDQLEYHNQRKNDENDATWAEEAGKLAEENLELRRIIGELIPCYDDGLIDISLLRNIESTKQKHNLSDKELIKVFNISRKKLESLRQNIKLSE